MIVCVAANPSVDELFEVERVEIGRIHRPISFVQVPGGKGLNVARAAHVLGAEVTATGILAGHAGRWIEEALAAEGVHARFAWVPGETRSSLSVADRGRGDLTEFYGAGTDVGPDGWAELEALVAEVVPGASWLTISGHAPPGTPDDGYARIVRIAREADVPVALDARDDALERAMLAGPALVKVNAEEAGALLGFHIATAQEARAAAGEIRGRLPVGAAAIVTRGAEGAVVALPDGRFLSGRLYARGPYPVGSGDAFLAGIVTALDIGAGWEEGVRLALAAAAANAEVAGAGRLDPERARALEPAARIVPFD